MKARVLLRDLPTRFAARRFTHFSVDSFFIAIQCRQQI